jgi:ubiquinone/menaquinone biosynthesis C-methylase UbiE
MVYRVFDYIFLLRFQTILGVGSGRAMVENLVARTRFVIASDVDPQLLHISKKHARQVKDFIVCSAFNLPFRPHSFHCIYSQGLLEHFERIEVSRILDEFSQVGDNVVFSVPLDTYRKKEEMQWFPRSIKEWKGLTLKQFKNCFFINYPNLQEAVFIANNLPKCKRKFPRFLSKYFQFNMAGVCGFIIGTLVYLLINNLGNMAWFIASFVGGLFHFILTDRLSSWFSREK